MKKRIDKSLILLKEIYDLVDQEHDVLERDIQTKICMPNCGRCCEVNTITMSGLEGKAAVLWLQEQPHKHRDKVLRACSKWLTQHDKYVGLFKGIGTVNCTPNEIDRANNEAQYIFQKTPCPLLDNKTKVCMIYPVRPLVCRAYGVFRVIARNICPRPPGLYESDIFRAYRQGTEACRLIKEKISQMEESINGRYRVNSIPIATSLYSELEPQKFMDLIYWGKVPTARLLYYKALTILWQDDFQEITDRESEVKFLCNPIPDADEPKDVTADYIEHVRKFDSMEPQQLVVAENKEENKYG